MINIHIFYYSLICLLCSYFFCRDFLLLCGIRRDYLVPALCLELKFLLRGQKFKNNCQDIKAVEALYKELGNDGLLYRCPKNGRNVGKSELELREVTWKSLLTCKR